jgi:hypothetical protein
MVFRNALPWSALVATAVLGWGACGSGRGGNASADARLATFRDADMYDTVDAPEPTAPPLPECPASCDDKNPCTVDACDPDTHLCRNDPGNDGVTCVSLDLCSMESSCESGLCIGSRSKDCSQAPDQCHESGYCVSTTGNCTFPVSTNGNGCDDGNLCTTGDQCIAGVCQGAQVQCGPGATCDPKTGACPGFPSAIWGLALDPRADPATGSAGAFSDLAVSPNGAVYFTDGFANTLDLGAGAMSTTSNAEQSPDVFDYNAVVARLDPATGRAVWSRSFGDQVKQSGCSVAVNANETVLISGFYGGTIDFGTATGADGGSLSFVNKTSFPKVFLAALDGVSSRVAWAVSTDIAGDDTSKPLQSKVTVDPSDNNFVLCASPTTLASGLGVRAAGGKGDVLIAKLGAQDGRVVWAEQVGSAADESCDAVAVDQAGKAYVTGRLPKGSSLDFGNGVVLAGPTGAAQQAMYVAQINAATGTVLWGRVFGSQGKLTGKLSPNAVATDGKMVWIGGSFTYTAVFDQATLTAGTTGVDAGVAANISSAFVVALDAITGAGQWAKNWGSNSEVLSLAIGSTGALIVGGDYASGMTFESGALGDSTSTSFPVPFVAKLTGSTGVAIAARGYASATDSTVSRFKTIIVDKSGASSLQDVPYAVGFLGARSAAIDLGAPVGLVSGREFLADAGASFGQSILFLVKFNP